MDYVGDTLTTGTADSNATATNVVDSARTESDDEWINAWIRIDTDAGSVAPEGEERRITDFVASSDTLTVFPTFTAAVTTSDTYSIREIFSYDQYKKAVNHAVIEAGEWWGDILNTFPVEKIAVTGTATATGSDSLTDSGKSWTTDEHIGRTVVIYGGTGEGQRRRIRDNTATKLVVPIWSTTPDTTSTYRIEAEPSQHIVICSSIFDYPLPAGCRHVYAAWIELPDTEEMGTASAATTTTLTDDSQAWTADEHIGRYIVIYDGTGRGQSRLITDNTTEQVTVPTWAITPDTTSKYKIKNPTEPTSEKVEQDAPWGRIYAADPDVEGGYIRFPGQHTEGAWVRLKYEREPMELLASTDVTTVPKNYIKYKGAAYLWPRKVGTFDEAKFNAQWNEQLAEAYSATHRQRRPAGTVWEWSDWEVVHAYDSPFRGT